MHEDTGLDTGWGMGRCSVCRCNGYTCKQCYENPPELPKRPPTKALLILEPATFNPELKESKWIYI